MIYHIYFLYYFYIYHISHICCMHSTSRWIRYLLGKHTLYGRIFVGLPPNCCPKAGSTQLYKMILYFRELQFSFNWNLSNHHRDLTSTPLNTFGLNWNAGWANAQIHTATLWNLVKSLSRRLWVILKEKGGLNLVVDTFLCT